MQAFAIEPTQGMSGSLLWLILLHGLWVGLAAAGVVALVFQARWTLSHRTRHTILLGALGLVAVGPPALVVVQYLTDWRQPGADSIRMDADVVVSSGPFGTHAAASSTPATPRPGAASPLAKLRRSLSIALDRASDFTQAARPSALVVWSLTVLGLTAVLALGVRGLSRLRREASPAPPSVQMRARRLGRRLRLRNIPAIQVHATLGEPCLCGVFRPVVLMPARWLASARPESLDAVLAHELAHAKRFDHLVNLAQRILEVLLFFHPGVHWLSRALRRQSEHCADALAVRLTGDPLALARALESMARFRAGPSTPRPLGAAFGGESTSLLPRIQELLGMKPIRPRTQIWPLAALPSAAAVALVAASIGFAQEGPLKAPATPPPPVEDSQALKLPSTPAQPVVEFDENHQISYEVRYIDVAAQVWLDHFQGRLSPSEPETKARGCLIDDNELRQLLADGATTIIQAPKVTALQSDRAIVMGLGSDNLTVTNPDTARLESTKTISRYVEGGGLRIEVGGTFSPRGTRISVDLRDSMRAELGSNPKSGRKTRISAQVPAPPEDRFVHSCEVPTGSSLAICLGRSERWARPRTAERERLVVVRPRRIVLKPEPGANAKPGDRTAILPSPR